jgi:hypothetical protein
VGQCARLRAQQLTGNDADPTPEYGQACSGHGRGNIAIPIAARGPRLGLEEITMNSLSGVLAFVASRAQVDGESSGSCSAFDRRRYTLPTLERGLEEAVCASGWH